jgi:hypothetical protein
MRYLHPLCVTGILTLQAYELSKVPWEIWLECNTQPSVLASCCFDDYLALKALQYAYLNGFALRGVTSHEQSPLEINLLLPQNDLHTLKRSIDRRSRRRFAIY